MRLYDDVLPINLNISISLKKQFRTEIISYHEVNNNTLMDRLWSCAYIRYHLKVCNQCAVQNRERENTKRNRMRTFFIQIPLNKNLLHKNLYTANGYIFSNSVQCRRESFKIFKQQQRNYNRISLAFRASINFFCASIFVPEININKLNLDFASHKNAKTYLKRIRLSFACV